MKYAFLFGMLSLMLSQASFAAPDQLVEEKSSLGQQEGFICPALAESEKRQNLKAPQTEAEEIFSGKLGAQAI